MDKQAAAYQAAIDTVTRSTKGATVGAYLTLAYDSTTGYAFVMVGPDGKAVRLSANSTSVDRLAAHWEGFVANLAAKP